MEKLVLHRYASIIIILFRLSVIYIDGLLIGLYILCDNDSAVKNILLFVIIEVFAFYLIFGELLSFMIKKYGKNKITITSEGFLTRYGILYPSSFDYKYIKPNIFYPFLMMLHFEYNTPGCIYCVNSEIDSKDNAFDHQSNIIGFFTRKEIKKIKKLLIYNIQS